MIKYLSMLIFVSQLFGQYDQLFVGSRPLSMGGAFTAVADDAMPSHGILRDFQDFVGLNLPLPMPSFMLWVSINPI